MDPVIAPTAYLFRMDCWKPETLPAKRFAEYVLKLAVLFGEESHVHFAKVRSGSTKQYLNVDSTAAERVYLRLVGGTTVLPDQETATARRDINLMLIEDGGVGYVKAEPGPRIIDFPGRKTPIAEEVTIHEVGTLDGSIVRIGGRGATDRVVPITLFGRGEYFPCRANKELAKKLASRLFECEVRVSGSGKWTRGADGVWRLQRFDIRDFSEIQGSPSLSAFVEDMRAVEGSGWNKVADAQAELRKLRED